MCCVEWLLPRFASLFVSHYYSFIFWQFLEASVTYGGTMVVGTVRMCMYICTFIHIHTCRHCMYMIVPIPKSEQSKLALELIPKHQNTILIE